MIYDYYNIICPKCNHRLIYDFKLNKHCRTSKCICNLVHTNIYKENAYLYYNNEEIIDYCYTNEEYLIINEIHCCLYINRKNKLFGYANTVYSFDEAFRCISNVFNLALNIKIKLENNILFI
jgi:hypothetical protein